jgi:hypothetical protein
VTYKKGETYPVSVYYLKYFDITKSLKTELLWIDLRKLSFEFHLSSDFAASDEIEIKFNHHEFVRCQF